MSNETQAITKTIESQIDEIRSMQERSLYLILEKLESVTSSSDSHLDEVYAAISELLKGVRDEGRAQSSDATHIFDKTAAHFIAEGVTTNLALKDLGREMQAIRESSECIASMAKECALGVQRLARDLNLLKLDVEFIRNYK